ncbi:MAG: LamG-like jellyroll fold domain-containing protein [Candidatus Micrarchaeales archaeon]
MKTKAQIAIEFLIVFSFVLIVFLVLFALIAQQRAVIQNTQTFSQLQLIAQNIALQINRAAQSGNGYTAQLPLLTSLGVIPYNLSITTTGAVIVTSTTDKQAIRSTAYSNVQSVSSSSAFLASGSNTVYNLPIANGSISIQNSFGTICVDYLCPINPNQSTSISLYSQIVNPPNFNGQNYVTLPNNAAVLGSADRSVSFWLKTGSTFPSGGPEPFSWGTEASGDWFGVVLPDSGGQSRLDVADWAVADHLSATYLQPNRWYQIVVTLSSSGTVFGLYINGVSDPNFPASTTALTTQAGPVFIGNRNDLCSCAHLSAGSSVANFQIYSNTLSTNQISQLYNEGINGAPLATNTLMAWLPLNGNTNDYSGNGYNGAMSNGVVFTTTSQIFAAVKNPLGKAVNDVMVGFATTLGNFTNGFGAPGPAISNYTNSNGIATTFLNQQGNNGQAVVGATAYNSNALPDSSLAAWYPLNIGQGSVAPDVSGNKNNGAFSGQPSWSSPNYYANFSGTGTYLNAPMGAYFGQNNQLAVSAWVYLSSKNNGPIFGVTADPPAGGWDMPFLSEAGLTVYGWIWNVNGNIPLIYSAPGPGWYNLAIAYNPSGSGLETFYVNGVPVGSGTGEYSPSTAFDYWTTYLIGAKPAPVNPYFAGSIANVQLYANGLAQQQISQIYQEGLSGSPLIGANVAGWWPLDGDIYDYSGNPNNGIIYGGISFNPFGVSLSPQQIANANASKSLTASFDGVNSFVNAGNIVKINSLSNWSVSFWMNSTNVNNYRNPFDANFNPAGSNVGPRFEQGDGGGVTKPNALYILVGSQGGGSVLSAYSNTLVSGTWYNVVAARSGNTLIGYLNGVQVINQANNLWPTGFGNLTFGRGYANAANRWYAGNLSDVQVYNQTLSPQQVTLLYQEGIGGVPIASTKLTGWWPLNGNANDLSLNGYVSANVQASNVVYKNTINYVPSLLSSLNYSGVKFNGQSSYISTGTSNLPAGSNPRSVFAWIYITNVPSNLDAIEAYGTSATKELSGIYIGRGSLDVDFASYANDFQSTLSVPLDSWELVGYTYSGTQVTIYVNGKSQSANIAALNTVVGSSSIGYDLPEGAGYFPGSIADVQIYNVVLSPSQVQQLYNEGIPPSASMSIPLSWSP